MPVFSVLFSKHLSSTCLLSQLAPLPAASAVSAAVVVMALPISAQRRVFPSRNDNKRATRCFDTAVGLRFPHKHTPSQTSHVLTFPFPDPNVCPLLTHPRRGQLIKFSRATRVRQSKTCHATCQLDKSTSDDDPPSHTVHARHLN